MYIAHARGALHKCGGEREYPKFLYIYIYIYIHIYTVYIIYILV